MSEDQFLKLLLERDRLFAEAQTLHEEVTRLTEEACAARDKLRQGLESLKVVNKHLKSASEEN